jgi:hypothetical protein
MPENQTCELCELTPAVHWDHNHQTNEHRGWLCKNCNTGLGIFFDDVSQLEKAINYLNGNQI